MALCNFWRRPRRVTVQDLAVIYRQIDKRLCEMGTKIMADVETAAADQAEGIAAVKQAFTDAFSVLGAKIDAQAAQIAALNDQLHQAGNLTGPQQDAVDAIDAGAKELQALAAEVEAKLTPAPASMDTPVGATNDSPAPTGAPVPAPTDAPSGDGPTS